MRQASPSILVRSSKGLMGETRDGRVSGGVQWRLEVGWGKEGSPEGGRGRAAPGLFVSHRGRVGWPCPSEGKCNVHPGSPTSCAAKKSRWGEGGTSTPAKTLLGLGLNRCSAGMGFRFFRRVPPSAPASLGLGDAGSRKRHDWRIGLGLGTRTGMGSDREIGGWSASPLIGARRERGTRQAPRPTGKLAPAHYCPAPARRRA